MNGFWIGLGLVVLGFAIDNGLTNIARQMEKANAIWRQRP